MSLNNRVFSVLESIWAQKAVQIDNGNVLELKMMFWELNLRPKGQLINGNFSRFNIVLESIWAQNLKLSLQVKKNELDNRFKRSRIDLSAKSCPNL